MLLKEKLENRKLILASKSPRRRELLAACGLDFVLGADYDCDEVWPDDLAPNEVPVHIAGLKSNAYPDDLAEGEILLTADTIVSCEGQIIGKPADRHDAVRMLKQLSGRRHTVITGVVLRTVSAVECFSVMTDVWFRVLRDEEIEYYVDNFRPFDKAGSYGIQEWIGYVGIGRIEGSFYNVMGLPIQSLYVNLERFIDGEGRV